tara:strand:+ start:360 stop:635 length:276 start_codon:yes stop_codon:yes gene_type:complete
MEALLSDDDEYTPSYDDEDEYSSESDDFLIHRDSDELQVFMNEYEKTLKLNLYNSIEVKVNPSNQEQLESLLLFLISNGIEFNKSISFITE